MPDRHDAVARLTAARQAEGARKAEQVLAAIRRFEAAGTPFTIVALARAAEVSRRFLYDHADLLDAAEGARLRIRIARAAGRPAGEAVTEAGALAELAGVRAENAELKEKLAAAEARVEELTGGTAGSTAEGSSG
jgi:hypothetical protein